MSTQQDIYAVGSERRPPILNKENYVPWSSRLLRYAKSRANGKLIHNSIINGPYVRQMIPELGDTNRKVTPEWSRHVTIVHQTKDLHTADYTQLYDFLKYNQKEIEELKAEQLAKIQDPLALMENSNNPYRISSNLRNRQIAQPGMNMGQDRQMQMVRGYSECCSKSKLMTFLLQNHFFKGTIDLTLFIRRINDNIIVVQVYVDDIIFGSTHPRYAQLFSDLMKSRFEMSMMGEMTFFLGLQVNQSPYGIFINQSKYVLEILKKYGMESCDPVGTPMEIKDKLDQDHNGTLVDATKYHSMIGALMYLTSSRLDIVHATCLCARYQAKPTEKHLKEVKMIFRYLRGTINTSLWYSKDSGFELTGFSDADYAGCKDTFKSTFGGA
nr:uncharacterized mitochondrial protein AtMg00810-like [Tanacetum cinerariifolium]